MTNRETTVIAIKAFAIYIVLSVIVIPSISFTMIAQFFAEVTNTQIVLIVIALLVKIVIILTCLLLWKTANSLLNEKQVNKALFPIKNTEKLNEIILIGLGIYVLIESLASIVVQLKYAYYDVMRYGEIVGSKFVWFTSYSFVSIIAFSLVRNPSKWLTRLLGSDQTMEKSR